MFGYIVLGLLVGGGGYFIGKKLAENSAAVGATGEIYAIGLSGLPNEDAHIEPVGVGLIRAMGWRNDAILDAMIDLVPGTSTDRVLSIAFNPSVQTPQLPRVGFSFNVGHSIATVTFVQKQPARVQNAFT